MSYNQKRMLHKRYLIMFVIIHGFETKSAQLPIKDNPFPNIASQCILGILHKYFADSKKIAVTHDNDQRQLSMLDHILKYTNNPVILNYNEHPKGVELDTRIPSDATLILNKYINITEYLESNLFTENTVFFTVVWGKGQGDMGRVFSEFWNYNVVDTFVLEVRDEEIYVYEYMPYVNCKPSGPMLLDKWSEGDFVYGRIKRVRSKVLITDLRGCHMNVTVVDIPPTIIFPNEESIHGSSVIDGVEGRILMIIANKLNVNFTYKAPDDGQRWGFITPEPGGAIGDVYYRKSFIACGLHTPNIERFSYLDSIMSSSGVTECISWMVPTGAAKRRPVWVDIFITEFTPLTWFCFISVLTMTVTCFTLFAKALNSSISLINSFIFLLSSSMGVTVYTPRTKTLKTLYAAWIWYGLLTTTAYESAVKSKLTVPLQYKDINTFEELIESGLELYGVSNTIRVVISGNEDPDIMKLGEIIKPTNKSINEIVEKIIGDRKTGYLREYTTFLYNAYKNRKAIGEIHRVRQCGYQYYPTMYMQKRSPVTPVVRRIVSDLYESGILLWWRSLYIKRNANPDAEVIQLSIKHMATPFFAYVSGISLSAIVFAGEHVKYHYRHPKRSKSFL